MQNEILKPVLDTDEVAVPRYDIVGPNGSVIQQNVELRLKNEVVQEGTPYDEESVLPASLREQLKLPQSATPAEALFAVLNTAGGAVRRNRPPTSADAESVGKIWVVPEMTFRNMMPNAITQSTSSWSPNATTVSVASNAVTAAGNGSAATTQISATMNASVRAGDIVFTQLHVTVNHDANMVVAELTLGNQVLATKTLNVPAAGDTMLLQARTAAEANGTPVLKIYATYNTAAVQSGKGFTVKDITVWNLTGDMCEAQEGNEFTQPEAITYIGTFGQFQTREYEYSTWWWILRGVSNGVYLWERMFDEATTAEATGGTNQTSWMSPLRTQEFLTSRLATQTEVNAGTDNSKVLTPATSAGLFTNKHATTAEAEAGTSTSKWMSPARVKAWWDKLYSSLVVPIAKGGTGLTAAPSMLTNLATTSAASPLQASPRPGVTGTLPIGNGGTGMTSSPSMLVDLASTSAASAFAASPRPGVTGKLPIANGGTGATTAAAAIEALGGCRVEIGSYAGTGTTGASLTFSFAPKVLMVLPVYKSGNAQGATPTIMIKGVPNTSKIYSWSSSCGGQYLYVTFNNKTVSWTGSGGSWHGSGASSGSATPEGSLNGTDYTYYYIAIG